MASPRDRGAGFTLLEVLLVSVLAAGLITSVTMGLNMTTNMGASEMETRFADAERVMAEIEHGIRLSESVDKASSNMIKITTRYFIDTDDDLEEVIYTLSGGKLYREVIDAGSSVGTVEILSDVTHFWTSTLRIRDDFDAADYDGVSFFEGETLSVDRSVKVDYKLTELGQVDPDLVESYDSTGEKLALLCADSVAGETVTVTPPIKRANLNGQVRFVPIHPDSEYRPLVYGDVTPDSTNISIVFSVSGKIDIRCYVGGVVKERIETGFSWMAGTVYDVKLAMESEYARAFVKYDGTWKEIGSISGGVLDCDYRAFHFQSMTDGSVGTWDELEVEYPFVDVHLGATINNSTKMFYGGAVRRQP